MHVFLQSLWRGVVVGASTRDRAAAVGPESYGYTGSIAQGLYWLGFEVANIVVHGTRTSS